MSSNSPVLVQTLLYSPWAAPTRRRRRRRRVARRGRRCPLLRRIAPYCALLRFIAPLYALLRNKVRFVKCASLHFIARGCALFRLARVRGLRLIAPHCTSPRLIAPCSSVLRLAAPFYALLHLIASYCASCRSRACRRGRWRRRRRAGSGTRCC